jgi:hypothetical protein
MSSARITFRGPEYRERRRRGWEYVGGDRRPFLPRGAPGSWRESMVAVVRGLVVSEDASTLRLFAWGNARRGRHSHFQFLTCPCRFSIENQ